ncbi:MAG: hypothetical protein K6E51_04525 [Treponema sp.]|nr:hypothetical protein [Treponema sp.]
MKTKTIACSIVFFMVVSAVFAKSQYLDVPSKKEVTFIGRIFFDSDVDRNFLFESFGVSENKRQYPDTYVLPYFPGKTGIFSSIHKYDEIEEFEEHAWGVNGDYFYVTYTLPEDRTIYFDCATVFIGSSYMLPVLLPMYCKVQVPENEKFLYIGDFHFSAKGFAFEVSGTVVDEYDAAQDALNAVTKKQYTLCRANVEKASKEELKAIKYTYEPPVTEFNKWYKMLAERGLISGDK